MQLHPARQFRRSRKRSTVNTAVDCLGGEVSQLTNFSLQKIQKMNLKATNPPVRGKDAQLRPQIIALD